MRQPLTDAEASARLASELQDRIDELARRWDVTVDESCDTPSAVIGYGRRDACAVVLKVVKRPGDEWRSGEVLSALGGRGAARVHESTPGALLLERLDPGDSLVELVLNDRDEEATVILANVIAAMSPSRSVPACPTVQDWGNGFKQYVATGDGQIPTKVVLEADQLYAKLCSSQRNPRLLHGDLHHYNVLFDRHRGWLAIDPKGVVGEVEYEIGAALRNPFERPDLFVDSGRIERRVSHFSSRLTVDGGRVLAWAFTQAVLSAIWTIEDGFSVDADNPSLMLATAIRPLLER